jgi:mannose/fructose-specific phosphotransferase system component IIA
MINTYATFIVTHEQMAICLQNSVEKILGKQTNLFPYTNLVDSLSVLAEKIKKNIEDVQPDYIVFFVDLTGGSCWNLAHVIQKQYKKTSIIAGVNMPMVISYFTYMNELPFNELINKVLKDSKKGIVHVEGSY